LNLAHVVFLIYFSGILQRNQTVKRFNLFCSYS